MFTKDLKSYLRLFSLDIISTILPDIQTTESTFASQQQFDNNGCSVSSGICVWSISIPKIQNEKKDEYSHKSHSVLTHFLGWRGRHKLKVFFLNSFAMDSEQVEKAILVQLSYTTLGTESPGPPSIQGVLVTIVVLVVLTSMSVGLIISKILKTTEVFSAADFVVGQARAGALHRWKRWFSS